MGSRVPDERYLIPRRVAVQLQNGDGMSLAEGRACVAAERKQMTQLARAAASTSWRPRAGS